MASVLAEGVVGKVCEMAVQQVTNEVSLVMNLAHDFEKLKNIIAQINCFLNEADEERTKQKDSVKKWLQRVRDIAWEAEDILEECVVESMYGRITQSCTLSCNQLILRHKMGRKIKKVKARISSIVEDGNQLRISHAVVSHGEEAASSERQYSKRSSLLPRDSHPVGIQSKVESILSLLDNLAHPIIAVVGMGGIGKTYLLQHVFSTAEERYDKSIWLSVSQFYSVSKLQWDLAFHLGLSEQIKATGVSQQVAEELIYHSLKGKRCLIVLDDVWRATSEDNLILRLGLPTENNSPCKIVVTTRSREVCVNMNAVIYNMQYLSDEESWSLFCVYAFRDFVGNTPPQHLEKVGREIVKECGKLPLAIKTIGASLAKTTTPSRWESKLHQLKQVATVDDPIMDILKLSYNSLPAHLKSCFAYLSFFPEDEEIDCEYLINLWVAEGFIPAVMDQWDMAWDCLCQLANFCLVEVWEQDFNLTKYCKVHDLLLDLAICISRKNRCAFSVEEASMRTPSIDRSGGYCRIFLGRKDINDENISQRLPFCSTLLRTLSLSHNEELRSIPPNFFSSMTVLRVLHLRGTRISTLPECVGKMKLLKVLDFGATKIKVVPKCVKHLKSLSFLDISSCNQSKSKLPAWISELKCLHHLNCSFSRMPKEISELVSLRTLRSRYLDLSVEEDEFLRLENVGKMTGLQELWLNVNHERELKRIEEGILVQFVKMRRLGMWNKIRGMQGDTESALSHIPDKMKSMKDLESLELRKFTVPSWICCLANLREVSLWGCHCSNYPEMQTMPNLESLFMKENKSCTEFPKAFGKLGAFPHLRFLKIWDFPYLEEFPELEDGAMEWLEQFFLQKCGRVKKIGEGIERLKRLKKFDYQLSGTNELKERLKEGGEDWRKMKAMNPQVTIFPK